MANNFFNDSNKVYSENLNDGILVGNAFDWTVDVSLPTDTGGVFPNSSTIVMAKVADVSITPNSNLSIGSTIENNSSSSQVYRLTVYPNFNRFGGFKSISLTADRGVTFYIANNGGTSPIASNLDYDDLGNVPELKVLKEYDIVITIPKNKEVAGLEFVFQSSSADVSGSINPSNVTGLDDTIENIQSKNSEQDGRLDIIEGRESQLFDLVYPVGSIYMSVNSISPESLFGGTWERIKDRFLLSSGETYANGNSGGASTVTLSKAQMPTHTHTINNAHHTHKGIDNQYFVNFKTTALDFSEKKSPSSGAYRYIFTAKDDQDMYMHTTTGYESNTISNANEGSSQAHENMPPYLVVNIWKRTA